MHRKLKIGDREIIIATHNKGKAEEIRDMLSPFGKEVRTAADFQLSAPPETGANFIENARLKAKFVGEKTNLPVIADDSGLSVAALDGAPGVHSADWAIDKNGNRDYFKAMEKIWHDTKDLNHPEAAFVCVMVLRFPDGHEEIFEGRTQGHIIWPPRGNAGFGYDPFFVPNGHEKTFAEIPMQEKQKLSHRGAAMKKLIDACIRQ